VTDAADLGVRDAAAALADRSISSRELVDACLARIS
jgi:Asp-tRNA(Asn)/Glu-tRNA(Gln) amidotransferase A subunit family amidase